MAGSTSKKVVAIRFDREPVAGFISPLSYLQPDGVEVLTAAGNVQIVPYEELKSVCFVRDFAGNPWKENRSFQNRPKTAGLWLKIKFRDGDTLEGIVANNLAALESQGWTVTPPEGGFLNQKVFVPRSAVLEVTVLGVVGSPLRRKPHSKTAAEQMKIFE